MILKVVYTTSRRITKTGNLWIPILTPNIIFARRSSTNLFVIFMLIIYNKYRIDHFKINVYSSSSIFSKLRNYIIYMQVIYYYLLLFIIISYYLLLFIIIYYYLLLFIIIYYYFLLFIIIYIANSLRLGQFDENQHFVATSRTAKDFHRTR